MEIRFSTTSITDKGLYHKTRTLKKITGRASVNKMVRIVNDFEYHPYTNESKTTIENELKKYSIGRSYTIFEKDHGHQEGTYYILNRITVKDAIDEKEKDKFIRQNYHEKPVGGVMDYNEFMNAYNNESYATMDVSELNQDAVKKVIEREKLY